jgi:hypothetical protein
MFIKFCTPGTDLSRLYRKLYAFAGKYNHADGSQWDANLMIALLEIVCYFRCQNHSDPRAVEEYYSRMYNGYTTIFGHMFHLIGQPSGHFNTSTDNSLCNIIMMSYCAWIHDIPVETFLSEVLFFVCGDDLVWSDRTGIFTGQNVADAYFELGQYLEVGSLDYVDFLSIQFVATHPLFACLRSVPLLLHAYLPERMLPKSKFFSKNRSVIDRIRKIASLCQNVFCDTSSYQTLHSLLMTMVSNALDNGHVVLDADLLGTLAAASPNALERVYWLYD